MGMGSCVVVGLSHCPSQRGGGESDNVLREHSPQHQVATNRMKPHCVTNDGPKHGGQLNWVSFTDSCITMVPGFLETLRLGRIELEKGLFKPVHGCQFAKRPSLGTGFGQNPPVPEFPKHQE